MRKDYLSPELEEMKIVPSRNVLFDSLEEKSDNTTGLKDLLDGLDTPV